MNVARQIAQEISDVYESGKNYIILEMEHKQEWLEVIHILREQEFKGKFFVEIHYGAKKVGEKSVFGISLY